MLTQDQIQHFETHGFLTVENVIPEETLAPVRAEYEALLDRLYSKWQAEGRVGPPVTDDFWGKLLTAYAAKLDWFQPMDISLPGDRIAPDTPMHFGPAVFDLLTEPRLLDLVEDLIGPEITSNPIQHVRIKPPARTLDKDEVRGHVGGTDWHQDRGVTLAEADDTKMITVWIAVTDANIENGCLQVIPEKSELLPHCPYRQTAIANGLIDTDRARPLPVKSGGVVIFDPATPHASLPNISDVFRWSFDIRFNVTGQPTGRSHFPDFVARSKTKPDSVLTDWREWKGMWEEARAHLAGVEHIDIHRWDSDAPVCA